MARLRQLAERARNEAGFGLVELLIAMTVLAVGVLAVFAMFEAGIVQIRRASTVTTAAALLDAEMEKFRAIRYDAIGLDETDVTATDSIYKADSAYDPDPADRVNLPACGSSPCTTKVPVQTITGADGRSYRVDTYVTWQTVSNGVATGRNVKLVTILVRDGSDASKVWARVSSSFDESTGL